MRTSPKYQSKPTAVRHPLRSEEENDDEEEGRGPQIIVLPRITLNKNLGIRRDLFLSLLPCLQGDKDLTAKKTKILKNKNHQQQNTYCK
jgi:hypothetical protein